MAYDSTRHRLLATDGGVDLFVVDYESWKTDKVHLIRDKGKMINRINELEYLPDKDLLLGNRW